MKLYKISLDFHGVIDVMPEFFGFFTRSMISCGCEIHIVTGGLTQKDIDLLSQYDIQYTTIFSILEYHKEKKTPVIGVHPKHGFDIIANEEWEKTKGEYCQREGIDFHIDDTSEYSSHFKTPFSLFSKNF